jgi:hypothetical protein
VRWLVLAVPGQYKGSHQTGRVAAHVSQLFASSGVQLDLDGVAVVEF